MVTIAQMRQGRHSNQLRVIIYLETVLLMASRLRRKKTWNDSKIRGKFHHFRAWFAHWVSLSPRTMLDPFFAGSKCFRHLLVLLQLSCNRRTSIIIINRRYLSQFVVFFTIRRMSHHFLLPISFSPFFF